MKIKLFILFLFLFPLLVFALTLQDYWNTGDDDADGTAWRGQTFIASSAYTISELHVKVYQTGTCNVNFALYEADANHKPTGSELCDGNDNTDDWGSSPGDWKTIEMTSCPALEASQEYAIISTQDSSGGVWRFDNSAGYANGYYVYSLDSGSTWNTNANNDFMFELYSSDETPEPPAALDYAKLLAIISLVLFIIVLFDFLRRVLAHKD